jgi:hypothetical protein
MKAAKILSALLVLTLAGAGTVSFLLWQDRQDLLAAIERLKMDHEIALDAAGRARERALEELSQRHEERVAALNADFEGRLDALRDEQRQQMATAYKEFENIFEGNRQTIEYINALEGKVKSGQQLSRMEVEKLTLITAGLAHLQKQYQRPLQEFTELEAYFERRLGTAPAAQRPKTSMAFFRRAFSRDFREAEKQFYREEGQREAFESAQQEFSRVYASAGQAMRAVNLNADEQLKKLYALIDEKDSANQQDLSDFFIKARQALRTHQEVLQFEPEAKPQTNQAP